MTLWCLCDQTFSAWCSGSLVLEGPGESTEEEEVYTMLPSMSFNIRCRGSCTWVFPHSLHPLCLISLQMLVLNLDDVKMYPKEDGELKRNYLFGANSLFCFFLMFYFFVTLSVLKREEMTLQSCLRVWSREILLSDLTHLLSSYCVICPFRL